MFVQRKYVLLSVVYLSMVLLFCRVNYAELVDFVPLIGELLLDDFKMTKPDDHLHENIKASNFIFQNRPNSTQQKRYFRLNCHFDASDMFVISDKKFAERASRIS